LKRRDWPTFSSLPAAHLARLRRACARYDALVLLSGNARCVAATKLIQNVCVCVRVCVCACTRACVHVHPAAGPHRQARRVMLCLPSGDLQIGGRYSNVIGTRARSEGQLTFVGMPHAGGNAGSAPRTCKCHARTSRCTDQQCAADNLAGPSACIRCNVSPGRVCPQASFPPAPSAPRLFLLSHSHLSCLLF
jgi:hypothetical protein